MPDAQYFARPSSLPDRRWSLINAEFTFSYGTRRTHQNSDARYVPRRCFPKKRYQPPRTPIYHGQTTREYDISSHAAAPRSAVRHYEPHRDAACPEGSKAYRKVRISLATEGEGCSARHALRSRYANRGRADRDAMSAVPPHAENRYTEHITFVVNGRTIR